MLKPYDPAPVQSDGTITWSNAQGVAFSLIPTTGGAYPVTVQLDPDGAKTEIIVTGPSEERGATPFSVVKLLGGTPGDAWRLWVAPTAADLRRQVLPEDGLGRALVHTAAGEEVCCVDFTADGSLPADGGVGQTALYLDPVSQGFIVAGSVDPSLPDPLCWDARNLRRLRCAYEALALVGDFGAVHGSLGFYLEGYAHRYPGALPLFTLPLGTTNQFADAGTNAAIAPVVAWVELGAPVDAAAALTYRSSHAANWFKVRLAKPANFPLNVDYTSRAAGGVPTRCCGLLTLESL